MTGPRRRRASRCPGPAHPGKWNRARTRLGLSVIDPGSGSIMTLLVTPFWSYSNSNLEQIKIWPNLPRMQPLRTTSYALLGLLRSRSLSASELADHMTRSSLSSLWPRAQSAVYQEPKNLEAHGLATSSRVRVEGRMRTVYRITPKGRRAFKAWLDRDLGGPSLECERFVQLALSSGGTIEQLRARVAHHRAELASGRAVVLAGLRGTLERGPMFPDRIHLTACIADYLTERISLDERWAGALSERIDAWPSARADDSTMCEAEALIEDCIRRLDELSDLDAT